MPRRLVEARRLWPVPVVILAVLLLVWLAVAVTVEPRRGGLAGAATTTPPAGHAGPSGRPKLVGYVPYWDQQRGFATVTRNLGMFDEVSPYWYAPSRDGGVVRADPENTRIDGHTVRMLQRRGIQVLPTVTNLGEEIPPGVVSEVLGDPARRRRHVQAVVALAVGNGYDGIDLDYENLPAADRSAYSAFVGEVAAALHARGRLLSATVHPKLSDAGYDERNQAQDFRAIGAAADQVRVMAYDYHWETSPPGAVAPAGWVDEVIAWTVTQIPAEKVVLGAVLLGYDWVGRAGITVDDETAAALAAAHRATIRRARDQSPWFTYSDPDGRAHTVWWEDARSVAVKLRVAARYRLGGVFFWRLGGEDPAVWSAVRAWLTAPGTPSPPASSPASSPANPTISPTPTG